MKGIKSAGVGVLFLAMAGLYLAGRGWRTRLSVHSLLVPNTWIKYSKLIHQPAYLPYVGKSELAGALGFDVTLLAWLSVLIALFNPCMNFLHILVA
ncbi:hypothetical protein [Xanthomonas sp. MUS 060]|uniref:hypothetical protein n=1 Tax=Xanthomonas sp. MUS 060 TaxID=1588031 RepID=UPI000AD89C5E|nr:hypothetical protein [Xanthomonas sp. MUS 060]